MNLSLFPSTNSQIGICIFCKKNLDGNRVTNGWSRLILPTGIRFATVNRWCGEDCWIGFSKAWFQVVLFKPLWCVRQTEDDSFPYSFRKIYCYRKPGSEIRKPCSRYALLPEAWFRDLTLYCSYAVPLPLYCGKFRITSCLYLFYFYF